jgi:predicted HTH transcriptional regulator
MTNYQNEMQKLVEQFVGQLGDLYRNVVADALGGGNGRALNGHSSGKSSRAKGAKRDPSELEAIADQFVEFVHKNPGLRIEQINAQLGTTTKDLALPIRKLTADGTVKTKGKKRSTTYFSEGKRSKKN